MRLYKRAILCFTGLLFVLGVMRSLYSISTATPVMADLSTLPVIVIDAGHGGEDGGAVGVDGIVEKDINLAISLQLRDMFAVAGFDVVLTRETDISIHDEGVTGTRNQKVSDLNNRLDLVHQYPGAVFLSIHQNKFGDSSSKGAQIFYSPNNPQSEALAEILQRNVATSLQPDNNRQIKEAGKNLFLMYNAQCPSVLIECGFLSNHDEAYRLTDESYQADIAFVTFSSVMEFLGLDAPGVNARDMEQQGETVE